MNTRLAPVTPLEPPTHSGGAQLASRRSARGWKLSRCPTSALLVTAILLSASGLAQAAPLFESRIQIESDLTIGEWTGGDTPGKVSAAADGAAALDPLVLHQAYTYGSHNGSGSGQSTGDAKAQLAPGLIKVLGTASGSAMGTGQGASYMFADASGRVEGDLIITGPAANVSGSFSLMLGGIVDTRADHSGIGRGGAGVSSSVVNMQLFAGFPNLVNNLKAGNLHRLYQVTSAGVVTDDFWSTGLLTGYAGGPAVLTVGFTNVPVGRPVRLELLLDLSSHSTVTYTTQPGESFDGFADAALDYFGALSFVRNAPVFALPDGFTVNSGDLNIIDNVWTPPVPEPRTALLLAGGLALICLVHRRRGAGRRPD